MKAVALRQFQPGDFTKIVPLLQELWPTKKLNLVKIEKIFSEKNKQKDKYLQVVALEDNEIVGLITLSWRLNLYSEGEMACIDDLVVSEKQRRKGIGRKLLKEMFKVCKERKFTGVDLVSAFHRKGAHKFYQTNGFKKDSFQFEKYF